jgi:brefeldin A-resistance guanine nucleotide exchange factor 1
MGAFDQHSSTHEHKANQTNNGYSTNGKNSVAENPDQAVYAFAQNYKAQISLKLMFELIRKHGDNLRAGWKNVIDCVLQLFRMRVLPPSLTMVEDYVDPRGMVSIQRPKMK